MRAPTRQRVPIDGVQQRLGDGFEELVRSLSHRTALVSALYFLSNNVLPPSDTPTLPLPPTQSPNKQARPKPKAQKFKGSDENNPPPPKKNKNIPSPPPKAPRKSQTTARSRCPRQ